LLTAELAARDRRIAELFAGQMASRVKIEHLKNHLCAATFRAGQLGKTGDSANATGNPHVEAAVEDSTNNKDMGCYPEWTNQGEGDVVILSGDQQCGNVPSQEDQVDLFVDSRCTAVYEEPLHSPHSVSQSPTALQSYPSLDNPDDTDITKHLIAADVKLSTSAETTAPAPSNGNASASFVSDPSDSPSRSIS
jgi:hypothetical protein